MQYERAVEYIEKLGMFSYPPSLNRIKEGVKKLSAQNKFFVIHIAGTNGKGSVSAYVSCALSKAGYKTGLFISPHIFDIKERIQINGKKISKRDFCDLSEKIINTKLPLTKPEFLTLMAFLYFNKNGVEVAVLETGLGGRFDATNAAENKLITAITKIGLDHQSVLGNTVEKIAIEKCGIINTNKTVCAIAQPAAALNVIKQSSKALIVPNTDELSLVTVSETGNSFVYKGQPYKTTFGGYYQIENALTAIEILKNCGLSIPESAVKQGLKSAFMPARMQVVKNNPLVIVDGAHNIDGAAALRKTLQKIPGFTAVIGFMKDKDYKKVLSLTLPLAGQAICVGAANSTRSLDPAFLQKAASEYVKSPVIAKDIGSAIDTALKIGRPTVIYGSLYLAANALKVLQNDN